MEVSMSGIRDASMLGRRETSSKRNAIRVTVGAKERMEASTPGNQYTNVLGVGKTRQGEAILG